MREVRAQFFELVHRVVGRPRSGIEGLDEWELGETRNVAWDYEPPIDAEPAAYPFTIVLTNNMPKLFPFGEESVLVVNASEVQNGQWSSKLEFKPKARGNFAMSARLVCDSFLKRIGL